MSVHHKGFPIRDQDEIPLVQRVVRKCGGALILVYLVAIGPLAPSYWPILFSSLLLWTSPMCMRRVFDFSLASWMHVVAFLTEKMYGVHIKVFGYKGKLDDHCILIMNHRCHLDWFFLWGFVAKLGNLSIWKTVMKRELRSIPVFGWCVQGCQHIFMHRKWEEDKEEMSTKLHFFNAINYPVQLLLFPGGGDLTERSKAKSDVFAENNGLPKYDYVLHPHTKGFVFAVATLKKSRLDSVVDITVGYPDQFPPTEAHFFLGTIPREVHYYVERFAVADLPNTETGLAEWCRERWRVKEERLKYFYQHRHFPHTEPPINYNSDTMNISNGHSASNGAASMLPRTANSGYFGSYASLSMFYASAVQALVFVSNCYMLYYHFHLLARTERPGRPRIRVRCVLEGSKSAINWSRTSEAAQSQIRPTQARSLPIRAQSSGMLQLEHSRTTQKDMEYISFENRSRHASSMPQLDRNWSQEERPGL